MACQHFLPALTCMVAAVAAIPNRKDASCDFTGFDSYAAVSRILAKMPTYTEFPYTLFSSPPGASSVLGLEIGGLNASGLHHIQQYGPALPFCVNGSRVLQVDLIHNGLVTLSMPWRTCSGRQGSINICAALSRFTVLFRLVDSEQRNETALSVMPPVVPVALDGAYVLVDGAGEGVKMAAGVLSSVFSGVVRDMYNQLFFASFHLALQQAME
ncbi:uncharacterized protein LOC144151990 isoform X2 [Haemaphysalis longicornis]